MSDTQTQTVEAEAPAKTKAPKDKTPCMCSRLEAHSEVVQPEEGGTGVADIELTTGCPGTLTTKTFAPGHDAKAIGFLLEIAKQPELSLRFGSVYTDPDTVAKQLGDALYAKFLTGKANIDKKAADKLARDEAKAVKKAAAEAAKAQAKAEKAAAKTTDEGDTDSE